MIFSTVSCSNFVDISSMLALVFGFILIAVAITLDGDTGSMYIPSGWSWSSSQSEIFSKLEQFGWWTVQYVKSMN